MPIPNSPDLITSVFANAGDRTAPPQTDPSGFVNFQNGYGPDYELDLNSGDSSAKAVERQVQNYLFGLMTEVGQFWQQLGVPPWYSTMPGGYAQGALVGRVATGGQWRAWRSLANANVIDPNLNGQTAWEYVPLNTELLSQVAMPAGGVADIGPGGQVSELIQASVNFNTLNTGTWEFGSDAIANGSANAPVSPGSASSLAGMLEAKSWALGANAYSVQRYLDRSGVIFSRGSFNNVWTQWSTGSTSSAISYSVDTGAANAVQGNATLSSGAISDNQAFWVKVANANTGATTFSPNPTIAAVPLLGQNFLALQGGELVANGRILVVYNATSNNYFLVSNLGGALPVIAATKTNQAVNLGQLNAYKPAALATPRTISIGGLGSAIAWSVTFDGSANVIAAGTINNNAVTLGNLAQIPTITLLGNPSGATANVTTVGLAGGIVYAGNNVTLGNITPAQINTGNITSNGQINFTTAQSQFRSPNTNIANSINNPNPGIVVNSALSGGSGDAAYINFIRQGNYGANFGLDSDNQWKVGGGSMGASAYRVIHEGVTSTVSLLVGLNSAANVAAGFTPNAGYVQMVGSGAGNPNISGYIGFYYSSGVRQAYIGNVNGGILNIQPENGNTLAIGAATSINGNLSVTGTITSTGTASFNTSDETLKTDIDYEAQPNPLHRTAPWRTYTRIDTGKQWRGLLAGEVQKTEPLYVLPYDHKMPDGTVEKKRAIATESLAMEEAWWCGKMIDELLAKIETLENRLARLECK